MPETPERRIEELLRAYAAKRREETGAPLDLHPATRRLLQAEVARLQRPPAAPPPTWWNSLAVLWLRLAFAAAVFAVLGICVWWLVPRSNRALEMARNDASGRPLTVSNDLAEPGRDNRSAVLSRANAVAANRETEAKVPALNAPASLPPQPPPVRPPAAAPRVTMDLARAVDKARQLDHLAAARPTASTAPAANGLGAADRDLGGFNYFRGAEVTGGASRADRVAQSPPPASAQLKSGPARQVAAAPTLDGAGAPGQDSVLLRRMPTEQVNRYAVTTPTGWTAGASALKADSLSLAYETTRMTAGEAVWSPSQGGSTQARLGAVSSPLIPDTRSQPTRAPSEAVPERMSPITTVPPTEAGAHEMKSASGIGGRVLAPTQVAATAGVAPVATPPSGFVGQKAAGATDVGSGVRHHFVNARRAVPEQARAQALPPSNALNSFDFERSGDRVSIADADGSIYEGSVINEREVIPRESGQFPRMKPEAAGDGRRGGAVVGEASKPGQPGGQVLVFRAAGTNRSLNQPVVMWGVIRSSGDANALGEATRPRVRAAVPPATGPTTERQLPRTASTGSEEAELQLEGRVRIGTNESDFRAVGRPPERK